MGKEKPIEDILDGLGDPAEIPKVIPESEPIRKRRHIPTKVQIMLQIKRDVLDFYGEMAKREEDSRNRCLCRVLEEYMRYEKEQVK